MWGLLKIRTSGPISKAALVKALPLLTQCEERLAHIKSANPRELDALHGLNQSLLSLKKFLGTLSRTGEGISDGRQQKNLFDGTVVPIIQFFACIAQTPLVPKVTLDRFFETRRQLSLVLAEKEDSYFSREELKGLMSNVPRVLSEKDRGALTQAYLEQQFPILIKKLPYSEIIMHFYTGESAGSWEDEEAALTKIARDSSFGRNVLEALLPMFSGLTAYLTPNKDDQIPLLTPEASKWMLSPGTDKKPSTYRKKLENYAEFMVRCQGIFPLVDDSKVRGFMPARSSGGGGAGGGSASKARASDPLTEEELDQITTMMKSTKPG